MARLPRHLVFSRTDIFLHTLSNLPASRISLIGRDHEVASIQHELMQTAGRLLTLTGTGGVGKTQLALKVATGLEHAFPDGVWLVELASLAEPGLLAQSVALALHLRGSSQLPALEVLLEHLLPRGLLLVMDNCEHLVDACARLVDALLAAYPGLRVLATSRERLRVPGEVTYRVPSLQAPDSAHLPPSEELSAMADHLPPATRPSLLEDVVDGRRLELETTAGTVARVGREVGVPTPMNDAIYAALKSYANGAPSMP